MKTLRAILLVLTLATPVFAGEMGNGTPVTPTPTPQTPTASQPIDELPSGDMGNIVIDTAVEVALNLLQSIVSLI